VAVTHADIINIAMLGSAAIEQGTAAMNKLASYRAQDEQRTVKAASVAQALVASGHFDVEDQARLAARLSTPDGGLDVLKKIAEESSASLPMGNTYIPANPQPPASNNGARETDADRALLAAFGL